MMASCLICQDSTEPLNKVTTKGFKTIVDFSRKRGNTSLSERLEALDVNNNEIFVHHHCRRALTDKRKLNVQMETKETRENSEKFSFKINCLFCAKQCSSDFKNPSRKTWVQASTLKLKSSIMKECKSRLEANPDDEWASSVQSRLECCIDLIASKARYHPTCRLLFKSRRSLKAFGHWSSRKGRTANLNHMKCFLSTCDWLENQASCVTMKNFREKVKEKLGDKSVYSTKYLKKLLINHYGSHIAFSSGKGKNNLIYLIDMAKYIIESRNKPRAFNTESEKHDILQKAALLKKADIHDKNYSRE